MTAPFQFGQPSFDPAQPRPTVIAGRKFVGDYALPSDMRDQSRMDYQHMVLKNVMQAPFFAPVLYPDATVIDIGTGSGRWAIELAGSEPHWRVLGIDIKQPEVALQHPANYQFMIGDILKGLPLPDGFAHLTHARMLNFAIPEKSWIETVIREIWRVTMEWGYVELMEWGGYLYQAPPALNRLVELVKQAVSTRGINLLAGANVHNILAMGGFNGIVTNRIWVPVGRHGDHNDRVGNLMQVDVLELISGVGKLIVALNLETEERFRRLLAQAKEQLETLVDDWRCWLPFHFAYGQRV